MSKKLVYRDIVLNDDESLIRVIRRSPLMLVRAVLLPVILIMAAFFFLFQLTYYWGNAGLWFFALILLLALIWLLHSLVIWYYQVFIVTTHRLIDVDRQSLFRKVVSHVPLAKVLDVYYEVKGLSQMIFRVGNVNITLSDSKTRIEIKGITQPQAVQQLIVQLRADTLQDKLETTQLSARELVELVKKIKAGIGEDKFREIIDQAGGDEIAG